MIIIIIAIIIIIVLLLLLLIIIIVINQSPLKLGGDWHPGPRKCTEIRYIPACSINT